MHEDLRLIAILSNGCSAGHRQAFYILYVSVARRATLTFRINRARGR